MCGNERQNSVFGVWLPLASDVLGPAFEQTDEENVVVVYCGHNDVMYQQ